MLTIGSGICILLTLIVLTMSRDLSVKLISLFGLAVLFNQVIGLGYFLRVGGFLLTYEEYFLTLFSVMAALQISYLELKWTTVFSFFALLATLGAGLLILSLNPSSMLVIDAEEWPLVLRSAYRGKPILFQSKNVTSFIKFSFYSFVAIQLGTLLRSGDSFRVFFRMLYRVFQIHLLLGLIDICVRLIFSRPLLQLFGEAVFGETRNLSFSIYDPRSSRMFFQGLLREPSHFFIYMIPGLLIVLLKKDKTVFDNILLMISVALMIISPTMTAKFVLFFTIGLLMYVLTTSGSLSESLVKRAGVIGVVILIAFAASSSLSYLVDVDNEVISRLLGILTYDFSFDSETIRMASIIQSLHLILARPFFGHGIGSANAYSIILSLITNIGLVGYLILNWFYYEVFTVPAKRELTIWIFVQVLALAMGSFSMVISSLFICLFIAANCARSRMQVFE